MMVDKTIFMPEELDNIPLYKLRLILRDLGGTPGSKNISRASEPQLGHREHSVSQRPP